MLHGTTSFGEIVEAHKKLVSFLRQFRADERREVEIGEKME